MFLGGWGLPWAWFSWHTLDDVHSAMNVIEGEVRSLVHVAHRVRVQIGPVIAEVTQASVDKLGLAVGTHAVASFKATGTRLVPGR